MFRPSSARKSWLGNLADRYHETLDQETLSYLASRGIDKDAASGYRLGLVTEPDPVHEKFLGRLSIPFITPTGVVYMRFRCIEDHNCDEIDFHGKYEGVAGDETRLYNVPALHTAVGTVGICEGELDALVASEAGLASVGVPGASSFKPYWYRLFDDFERVLILGDGDAAGRKFVSDLTSNIYSAVPRPMPSGHDVSSYVVENGVEEFLRYVLE